MAGLLPALRAVTSGSFGWRLGQSEGHSATEAGTLQSGHDARVVRRLERGVRHRLQCAASAPLELESALRRGSETDSAPSVPLTFV